MHVCFTLSVLIETIVVNNVYPINIIINISSTKMVHGSILINLKNRTFWYYFVLLRLDKAVRGWDKLLVHEQIRFWNGSK